MNSLSVKLILQVKINQQLVLINIVFIEFYCFYIAFKNLTAEGNQCLFYKIYCLCCCLIS